MVQQPPAIADLAQQHNPRDTEMLRRALATGLSGTSQLVDELEAAVCRAYQAAHCIAVTSGSMAVAAVLDALGVERGQEIVVSPAVPICTVLPMLERGIAPVFCDVRPDNFGLDPDDVERAVSPRTAAVFEVPMWGYPAPIDETRSLTDSLGLPLVADLAHGQLTELHGRRLSAYALVSCYSTHVSKFLSTGEGGFVITDDEPLADRLRAVTRFGHLQGETVGLNMKLGGLQAAIGLARIGDLEARRRERLANRQMLVERISNDRLRELPVVAGGRPDGYALLLQAVGRDGRELVRYQVAASIPSDIDTYDNRPLYELPLLAPYARPCPHAEALLRSLTTVPTHEELTDGQLAHMAEVLDAF